ncbi:hypothetical protein [Sediminibacterium sp.]|uniref:hypothetical protein n=1 Tax=Sediminibacterium sp. TaxID=1917865 RepID=UPI0025F86E24|nr:hypothetical protein [Sediminibacterium sp.]MBT9484385.1 hypothetical protein [Sediminibacterium sp.]HQS25136.1 hypothetical protein [Sediminibacterium sp.]
MKKIFFSVAIAALTFTACDNNENSTTTNTSEIPLARSVNQDSIDKAHGHSHDPQGENKVIEVKPDTVKILTEKQDSIDKIHGHKH